MIYLCENIQPHGPHEIAVPISPTEGEVGRCCGVQDLVVDPQPESQAPTAPKPSVGRIVHYVSRGSADGVYQPQCRAAIITEVDEYQPSADGEFVGHVDLCVLNPTGMFFNRGVLAPPPDDVFKGGTWHWPERV